MIILTNAEKVRSSLGSDTTADVAYNNCTFGSLIMDPLTPIITGSLRVWPSADTTQPPVSGNVVLDLNKGIATLDIIPLGIATKRTLNSNQITAITNIMSKAIKDVEQGLISGGMIAGTMAP